MSEAILPRPQGLNSRGVDVSLLLARRGGWVTGGTATRMAADAAAGANAQMAAADCVIRFEHGPDSTAQLAALTKAENFNRSDLIEKGGWATMAGSKEPVSGAALICAQKLVNMKTAG